VRQLLPDSETRAALVGMVDNVQLGLGTTTRLQAVRSSIRIPAVDKTLFNSPKRPERP
jgi:hypothetical protein